MKRRAPLSLLLAALLAVAPASSQSLPDLGDASSASLSDSQERTIGNRIMREVRVDPLYIDDPEVTEYINSLGARLLSGVDGPRRDIDFFVVQDETINAFALVGGHIGVHTGLFTLTQNESELAGVLAHEIAHITQRHQARAIHGQRGASFTSLAALAIAILASRGNSNQSGQVTEAAIAGAAAYSMQNMIDYTREHEREADRVGLTILERTGFSPRAMATFFERLLRANRLNELKGAPSYLRTHPLTTERIADIQDRVESMPSRLIADTGEYRLVKAKLRATTGPAIEAISYFRAQIAERTVLRPREENYGLAVALRRTREFDAAWKALAPLRDTKPSEPQFELLAAQLLTDQGRLDEALKVYRAGLRAFPQSRGIIYGFLNLQLQAGHPAEVIADLDERLRNIQDDPKLYELQARAFAATGKQLAQHRAQAEAHFRRGNLGGAVEQLEQAVKIKAGDFYEASSAESRLRELRAQLDIERAAEKALKIS